MVTLVTAGEYVTVSVGENVAERTWLDPAFGTVPDTGLYENDPGTPAVAFSCDGPKAVPYPISAGLAQLTGGNAAPTNSSSQAVSWFVAPVSRSATKRVHSPLPLTPMKLVRVVERAVVSRTAAGSTLRPSGCQMPLRGDPAGGVVML